MEPFVTTDGTEIPLRSVGQRYVQQVMSKFPMPEVPTYEAPTAAGEVEVHQHNVKYGEDGKLIGTSLETDEDWALWNAYKEAELKAISDRWQAAARFLLYQAVIEDPPPLEEWSVDFSFWEDLTPPDPEDKRAFKVFWIENELITDPDDLARLLAQLYVMGGVVEKEGAKELEAFFRATVERLTFS